MTSHTPVEQSCPLEAEKREPHGLLEQRNGVSSPATKIGNADVEHLGVVVLEDKAVLGLDIPVNVAAAAPVDPFKGVTFSSRIQPFICFDCVITGKEAPIERPAGVSPARSNCASKTYEDFGSAQLLIAAAVSDSRLLPSHPFA